MDYKCKCKIKRNIKRIQGNIEENLDDLGFDNMFWGFFGEF